MVFHNTLILNNNRKKSQNVAKIIAKKFADSKISSIFAHHFREI